MKVAVYGAGATGGYLGAKLALAGVDTTLIARGAHLEAMQRSGVRLLIEGEELVARPFCTGDPAEAGPQDYVIVALKAHSTPGAVGAMQPLLGPETAVVTAQNGVPWWYFHGVGGEWEGTRLESVDPGGRQWGGIGPQRAIGCVVYVASEIAEPGVIRHLSGSRCSLGEPTGQKTARAKALSRALVAAGVRAPVRSIRREMWVKLLGNVSFNPISALTLATLDRVATEPGTRAVARAMMEETRDHRRGAGRPRPHRLGAPDRRSGERRRPPNLHASGPGAGPHDGDRRAGRIGAGTGAAGRRGDPDHRRRAGAGAAEGGGGQPPYPPNSVTSKILPRIRIRLMPVKTMMLIQVNARAKADG